MIPRPNITIYPDDLYSQNILLHSDTLIGQRIKEKSVNKIVINKNLINISPFHEEVFFKLRADDFSLISISNSTKFIYGRAPEDFSENPDLWKEIVFFEDYEYQNHIFNLLKTNGQVQLKRRVVLPDGSLNTLIEKLYLTEESNLQVINGIALLADDLNSSDVVNISNDSNLSYGFILNNTKDVIFRTDADGRWVYLNPAWEKISGYSVQESLGEFFLDFIFPDDRKVSIERFNELNEGIISTCKFDSRIISRTGILSYIEIITYSIFDSKNNFIGIAGILKDLNEKNQTLSRLKEIQDRNSALLKAIPDLFLIIHKSGVISDYNIADKTKLLFEPEDFINRNLSELFPVELADEFKANIYKALKKGKMISFEYNFASNHIVKYFEARISRLDDNQVIALIRNIDKQKAAENKLEDLNSLHILINGISSDLSQSSQSDTGKIINMSLAQLGIFNKVDRVYIFKFNDEDYTCDNIYEWCAHGVAPEMKNLQGISLDLIPQWIEKFNNNEYVYIPSVLSISKEYSVEKEMLETRGIRSLIASPMNYNDNVIGFIGFDSVRSFKNWDDETITLLKLTGDIFAGCIIRNEYEKELIRQKNIAENDNKAKSELLASLSNEILKPMKTISEYSEMLLLINSDENISKYADTINKNSKSIISLINDISDLSEIETGILAVKPNPMSVRLLLDEIKQIVSQKTNRKNITLNIQVQEGFPEVILFDDERLKQILLNIVGNAINFSDSGNIDIFADITYGLGHSIIDASFTIKYTGEGKDRNSNGVIFNSFRQVDTQIDSRNDFNFDRTGLGLVITKRLVDLLGGKIHIENTPENCTKFQLDFKKIKVSNENLAYSNSSIKYQYEFDDCAILIVDDVVQNRELIKSYMQSYGIDVVETCKLSEVIEFITESKIDLVLMDTGITEHDRYENLKLIRSNNSYNSIPVVAITKSPVVVADNNFKTSFDYILNKPVSKDELLKCLAHFLPHSKHVISNELSDTDVNILIAKNLVESIDYDLLIKFIEDYKRSLRKRILGLPEFFDSDYITSVISEFNSLADNYGIEAFSDLSVKIIESSKKLDIDTIEDSVNAIIKSIDYCKIMLDDLETTFHDNISLKFAASAAKS
ncbi:MAG: PAS domain S-box protein [Candidatus Kapabacteria bacterium]|nr:PAS domain S-box protein [Ignavibacteriota bacterium]MCW5885915.1 PAS domain S-box protein [Candidatus Kapabacteria bacterium]